jgi:hypothetical protein
MQQFTRKKQRNQRASKNKRKPTKNTHIRSGGKNKTRKHNNTLKKGGNEKRNIGSLEISITRPKDNNGKEERAINILFHKKNHLMDDFYITNHAIANMFSDPKLKQTNSLFIDVVVNGDNTIDIVKRDKKQEESTDDVVVSKKENENSDGNNKNENSDENKASEDEHNTTIDG